MAIFAHSALQGITTDQYDALNAELRKLPGDPFAGCLSHVCIPSSSGLHILDLWESEEAMEKFGTIVMPIAERLGLPRSQEPPTISKVHSYWVPGVA
ncbi:hypothetical protein ACIHCQ_15020 [Streptomyces sp. NPDC052236]|uniref:hypothetical protein n=1 Tax=Streptomyces sp. NPDC052236 TaxID=3365686 RepID=UPI0037D639E1